ncbi:MAG: hypothetical protein QF685_05705 [Verrucomicrobiota bacterium]|jgi:predicted protein tyrosine phosphatase|nr:hypothetical protein [Verrucomicrobiota bacterium]
MNESTKQNNEQGTIRVVNIAEAAVLHHDFDAVISVTESPNAINFGHPQHHAEFFADVEEDWGDGPSLEQIGRICRFVRGLAPEDSILVHCAAGVSRSTATALGILTLRGYGEREALELLSSQHPKDRFFWPNRLVLNHFDELLGTRLADVVGRTPLMGAACLEI